MDALPAGEPVAADELQAIAKAQGVEVRQWDVVLIRTGYLKYWPDATEMAKHKTAGPDLSAAEWLLEKGVVASGTDTETYEVQPAPDRGTPANPQPVHTKLLIENGIYLLESVYLEEIARDKVYEFLFVMLPVKIRGAPGGQRAPRRGKGDLDRRPRLASGKRRLPGFRAPRYPFIPGHEWAGE